MTSLASPRPLLRLAATTVAALALGTPAAHAAKANLTVTNVTAAGAYGAVAQPGESVRVSADVYNGGPLRVNGTRVGFVLSTAVKGTPIKFQVVVPVSLPAYATTRVTNVITVPDEEISYRTYSVWGCADVGDLLVESDETDNCRATPLTVVPDSSIPGLDPKFGR